MIQVTLDSAGFTTQLNAILAVAKRPAGILAVAGRAVSNDLRKHFRKRDRTPNKLGGKRTHFWLEVSRSVQAPVVEDETTVSVSITHPVFAQKLFGGLIRAKRVRFLTIPQTPEAYGRTARVFEQETGLQLIFLRTGKGDFERAVLATAQPGAAHQLTVQYFLTPSVDQDPDPDALPPIEDLEASAVSAAEGALERQIGVTPT